MKQDWKRLAVERILEDETLTADLVDRAAKILLDWGVAQVQSLPQTSQSDIDEYLTALKHTMQRINEFIGEAPPDDQAERIQTLLNRLNRMSQN